MYDYLIAQVDKRDTHTGSIAESCQYTVSELEGSIANMDPPSLFKWNSQTDTESEGEKAGVYMCQRESVTVLPKALDMTHAF